MWKCPGKEWADKNLIWLCNHVSFLLSPFSASLLSMYHFVAWEKAQSMWSNHRAGCQQPQWHSAKMVVSTVGTADVTLSSKRSFPFRAAQVSVDKAIQVALTAEWHQDLAELLRAYFMCKMTQGQSAALFKVEAPLFSFICGVFFPLYNSLIVSISHFLHLCSSFCDCVGKWCLFCSLQLSMTFCEKHPLPSTTVYEICRSSSKKLMLWLSLVTLTREAKMTVFEAG